MGAHSACPAQGLLPRGKYPIGLAWQPGKGRAQAEEAMLQLAQRLLSAPQLGDAVGVIRGRPKPSYPPAMPGGKAFASHAREDGSLPAKKGQLLPLVCSPSYFFLLWANVAPLS